MARSTSESKPPATTSSSRSTPTTTSSSRSITSFFSRKASKDQQPKKQGRLSQMRTVFAMTRKQDPAVLWWMLLAFFGPLVIAFVVGLFIGNVIFITFVGLGPGLVLAMLVLARRAERAAFASIAGQPGATGAALQNLRRGWSVEQEPVAFDARTQDLVFRAVGRPGVVLLTEGPLPRVQRLAETERKRITRVLGSTVPVVIVNGGDGDGRIPLPKVSRHLMRMRPQLSKTEVSEVSKRLRALGGAKLPIPKGVDPTRARPDRRAGRGR